MGGPADRQVPVTSPFSHSTCLLGTQLTSCPWKSRVAVGMAGAGRSLSCASGAPPCHPPLPFPAFCKSNLAALRVWGGGLSSILSYRQRRTGWAHRGLQAWVGKALGTSVSYQGHKEAVILPPVKLKHAEA